MHCGLVYLLFLASVPHRIEMLVFKRQRHNPVYEWGNQYSTMPSPTLLSIAWHWIMGLCCDILKNIFSCRCLVNSFPSAAMRIILYFFCEGKEPWNDTLESSRRESRSERMWRAMNTICRIWTVDQVADRIWAVKINNIGLTDLRPQ